VADYLDWLEDAGFEGSPRFLGRDAAGRDVLTFLSGVCADPVRVGLIDFDLAGPATAFRDSFNTAMHWVPLQDPADAWHGWERLDPFRRLRIFADAYGWTAEERLRLPEFGAEAASLSYRRRKHNASTLGGGWAEAGRGCGPKEWVPSSSAGERG
jgi:hypothetical protein